MVLVPAPVFQIHDDIEAEFPITIESSGQIVVSGPMEKLPIPSNSIAPISGVADLTFKLKSSVTIVSAIPALSSVSLQVERSSKAGNNGSVETEFRSHAVA